MKTYSKNIRVSASDLDELQHVNNVQYLQWVQEVAKEHWEQEASSQMLQEYVWVVINHFIEYKGQAVLNDELTIKTYVSNSAGVTSTRIVEIFKNDQLITKTTTNWCLLSAKTKRPVRVFKELALLFD